MSRRCVTRCIVTGGPIWPHKGNWLGFCVADASDEQNLAAVRRSTAKWMAMTVVLTNGPLWFSLISLNESAGFWRMFIDIYLAVFVCVHLAFTIGLAVAKDDGWNRFWAYALGMNFMHLTIPYLCSSFYMFVSQSVHFIIFDCAAVIVEICAMVTFFNQISLSMLMVQTLLLIVGHFLQGLSRHDIIGSLMTPPEPQAFSVFHTVLNTCGVLLGMTIWVSFPISRCLRVWAKRFRIVVPCDTKQGQIVMEAARESDVRSVTPRDPGPKIGSSCTDDIGPKVEPELARASSSMAANKTIEPMPIGAALQIKEETEDLPSAHTLSSQDTRRFSVGQDASWGVRCVGNHESQMGKGSLAQDFDTLDAVQEVVVSFVFMSGNEIACQTLHESTMLSRLPHMVSELLATNVNTTRLVLADDDGSILKSRCHEVYITNHSQGSLRQVKRSSKQASLTFVVLRDQEEVRSEAGSTGAVHSSFERSDTRDTFDPVVYAHT